MSAKNRRKNRDALAAMKAAALNAEQQRMQSANTVRTQTRRAPARQEYKQTSRTGSNKYSDRRAAKQKRLEKQQAFEQKKKEQELLRRQEELERRREEERLRHEEQQRVLQQRKAEEEQQAELVSIAEEKKRKKKGRLRILRGFAVTMLLCGIGIGGGYAADYWLKQNTVVYTKLIRENTVDQSEEKYYENIHPHMDELQEILTEMLGEYTGTYSVYVKNLATGEEFGINVAPQISASTIKLWVAGAYFTAVNNGYTYITEEDREALYDMLSMSQNDGWAHLEDRLTDIYGTYGHLKVNEFAQSIGCTDTGRLLNSPTGNYADGYNYTSVRDLTHAMELIYRREFVSEWVSETMQAYLTTWNFPTKVVAGLPPGIRWYNKTGDLGQITNEVCVVFGERVDYIMAVMVDDVPSTWQADANIAAMSSVVYHFLNDASQYGE